MSGRKSTIMVLVMMAVLCMGGTCRQEVGQSTADAFMTTLAQIFAETLADVLVDGTGAAP